MTSLLITATNRGIGLELARQAIGRGWLVYGSARTREQAELTGRELGSDRFVPLVFDVTDHTAVANAAAEIDAPIDVLINNAGIIGPDRQATLDMDFAGFAKTLEINTLAPLAVAQAFLPHLKRSENGRIVTISSQMSWMGYAKSDRIAYRASKAAVNKVMQGLSTDLKPDNITVALVDPGWVRTDMGGPEADNDPVDVAGGILDLAGGLTQSQTGRFFKWNGEERDF
ncbi:SDR family oxidoreductase [Roseibium sp. RKSG952]|uniref:SDR family oxidoreductase n=1 Tax=Roseibium sp. RKSG952 TaxID=2529384 RepID=UPI0012BC4B5A|nr:SDR family oxidoreductase [Roseibium sp. RKSG952]MTH97533.1 SDR family oxidoreductase [Roseibium sp. RKSG952]